ALVERRGRRRRRRGGADADDGDILNANEMWHSPDALACIGIDETYRGPHPISGGSDAPIDVVSNGRGLSRPPIYLMPGVREIQDRLEAAEEPASAQHEQRQEARGDREIAGPHLHTRVRRD